MDERPDAGQEPAPGTPLPGGGPASPRAAEAPEDPAFLAALRQGDEAAFVTLVERHQAAMLRIAMVHCPRRDAAEEVVQETWLAVLEGIGRFEGRASLRTWIFAILTNRAKTRGIRERRSVPLSSLPGGLAEGDDEAGPTVDPSRFAPAGARWPGHWRTPPRAWDERPDHRIAASELRARIDAAIAALPPRQREIITLRDVEELSSDEVRNVLGLSETNQRVLLHRARAKVRAALEDCFDRARTA